MADEQRLKQAITDLLLGIEEAERGGCIDHLDCWDDAEKLWYQPIDRAKKLVGLA